MTDAAVCYIVELPSEALCLKLLAALRPVVAAPSGDDPDAARGGCVVA